MNRARLFLPCVFLLSMCFIAHTYGQQKFALVIGNGNYTGISRLRNPENDARDVAAALRELGFTVDMVINGDLDQMENSIQNLRRRLSASRDTYGLFFYAGHGVQANGENYLIPINATNIQSESHLRQRAVSVQTLLDNLSDAGNELNMIILDACRDNPFGWSRSGSRGLTIVSGAPTGSIVMYATSANSTAEDGTGRNGMFTEQLLRNLRMQSNSVFQVFDNTMNDVIRVSNGRQQPELSLRYPGSGNAYLGTRPAASPVQPEPVAAAPDLAQVQPSPQPQPQPSPQPLRPQTPRQPLVTTPGPASSNANYWSAGASVGSAFATPFFILTARGTLAPFRYSFLELGVDFGLVTSDIEVSYVSFYPFAHYAFFYPFNDKGGWYIGGGLGGMLAWYEFPEGGDVVQNVFALDFVTGFNVFTYFDISYTIRISPVTGRVSNKISAGFTYRF